MPGPIDSLTSSLPVPETSLPKDVREGTPQDKQLYRAALGFEQQLVTQLMQSLSDTAQPQDGGDDSEDDGSSDAGVQSYQQMMPQSMADAVISSGGTGLAEDLYHALRQEGTR
jgi:Rod binding domain-containing protein